MSQEILVHTKNMRHSIFLHLYSMIKESQSWLKSFT